MAVARVECYSGHTYAQEPRVVIWRDQRHQVAQVIERWRTPDGPAYHVQTESGMAFNLHYLELEDRWVVATLPTVAVTGTKDTEVQNQDERLCSQNH